MKHWQPKEVSKCHETLKQKVTKNQGPRKNWRQFLEMLRSHTFCITGYQHLILVFVESMNRFRGSWKRSMEISRRFLLIMLMLTSIGCMTIITILIFSQSNYNPFNFIILRELFFRTDGFIGWYIQHWITARTVKGQATGKAVKLISLQGWRASTQDGRSIFEEPSKNPDDCIEKCRQSWNCRWSAINN